MAKTGSLTHAQSNQKRYKNKARLLGISSSFSRPLIVQLCTCKLLNYFSNFIPSSDMCEPVIVCSINDY